jgi:hypothetical protein
MPRSSFWKLPAYVYLLPLLPVIRIFASNVDSVALQSAALSAAILFAVYLMLRQILVLLFFRHPLVDPLLACAFSGTFLAVSFIGDRNLNWYWAAIWLAVAVVLIRWPRRIILFKQFVPIFIGALCLQSLYMLAISPVMWERPSIMEVVQKTFGDTPTAQSAPAEKPDVYYIIFDRYARHDMLQKIYGFDNNGFLAELEKRGFIVPRNAYANYQRTASSIVSSLNFDYLDRLQTPETDASADWVPIYNQFQDFRAARVFKSMGYGTHFFGTWWEATRRMASADQNHNFYELPEALRIIYEYSLVVDAARLAGLRNLDPLRWQCERSKKMFDGLAELSDDPAPTFTFAHFLIPHPPFVTAADGRCMEIAEAQAQSRAENYSGQVQYTNQRILQLVDALMAKPGPQPLIILQADEGPWPEKFAGEEVDRLGRDVSNVDWLKISDDELREKMAIFAAYYLPEAARAGLNDRSTPVNTFRRILKGVFNVAIEPLPEKNMIFESDAHPYRYHDVTARLYAGTSP